MIDVRPATSARFDDVATMLGPRNPDASVCWCLSHRLDARTNRSLIGRARGAYVKQPSAACQPGDEAIAATLAWYARRHARPAPAAAP